MFGALRELVDLVRIPTGPVRQVWDSCEIDSHYVSLDSETYFCGRLLDTCPYSRETDKFLSIQVGHQIPYKTQLICTRLEETDS